MPAVVGNWRIFSAGDAVVVEDCPGSAGISGASSVMRPRGAVPVLEVPWRTPPAARLFAVFGQGRLDKVFAAGRHPVKALVRFRLGGAEVLGLVHGRPGEQV